MNLSQKIFGLLISLLSLTLIMSCSEDEEEVDREPLIIGTWTLASQNITNAKASASGFTDVPIQSFIEPFLDTLTIIPENSEFTFNEDRTYTVDVPQQNADLSGTWALSDDQSTITIAGLEMVEPLLGSSELSFTIQNINATNFSILTSAPNITLPDISIPNLPNLGTTQVSGDYQLNLEK